MGDNEPTALNAEINRSSCPYPLATNNFPMPMSTTENPGSLPESERHDDPRLTRGLINGTGAGNMLHNSAPTAPYMNEISAGERVRSIPTIEFTNPLAYQAELNSCNPPPSYDELFAPKNIIQPQTLPSGTFTSAMTATSPRTIIVPVTANIPGNRIITHPPAHLVGVRSTSTSVVGVETYLKVLLLLIAALGIFLVYVRTR